ncbi:MAG: hypothetical protein AAF682_06405 [Planctomycetota bacterium]
MRFLAVAGAAGVGALCAPSFAQEIPNRSAAPAAQISGAAPAPIQRTLQGPNAQPGAVVPGAGRLHGSGTEVAGGALSILVYDNSSSNGFAASAAQNISFFGTTVANSVNFNTLLTGGGWDVVAVDCPGTIPSGGWDDLIDFVNGGGRAVLSFWDWDNDSGFGDPLLPNAFDVIVQNSISLDGQVLFDSMTTGAFLGVSMPLSDFAGIWTDDGDEFTPFFGARGLAYINSPTSPVIVQGNGGRTIAASVLDEAGSSWVVDGSGVQLWENLIRMAAIEGPDVLVYDTDTANSLALQAAFEASPGGTVRATSSTYESLLGGSVWDAVLVDAPNNDPTGGWTSTRDYANGGGHVAMSFWDWDASSGTDPQLPGAFDVGVSTSFSWNGNTIFDSGTSNLFNGVSMPNSDWNDNFADDGDTFVPQGLAAGLANIGNPANPCIVWGNQGRTMALPVLDEAGPTWLGNGSGVQLWSNILDKITGPDASCVLRTGVLGTNPADYICTAPPVVGGVWSAQVDTTPLVGIQSLTTFVTMGLGGPTQGVPLFGYELLILPPYLETTSFGAHNIPVPPDPLLIGQTFPTQGARLEITGATVFVILLNGQDVTFGF